MPHTANADAAWFQMGHGSAQNVSKPYVITVTKMFI